MKVKEWVVKILAEWGEDELLEVLMVTKSNETTTEIYNYTKETGR